MVTNKNEAKTITIQISYDCKCKFNIIACSLDQKGIIRHVDVNVKVIVNAKRIKVGILANVFLRIANIAMIECDEMIAVMDIVATKITNAIATNVTSNASINFHGKKVRDCYILYTLLLVIILPLIVMIICCCYAIQKKYNVLTI